MASRPEDGEFRDAVAGVEPLKRHKRVEHARPAPPPVARERLRDEASVMAESMSGPLLDEDAIDSGEELAYLRDGIARETLRKLRRGHWAIQDGIDLHGMTREQASACVTAFLNRSLVRDLRCVRIVHGKGMGILKGKLARWLPMREEVLAFCQAPANEGGGGAVLVLLRSKR